MVKLALILMNVLNCQVPVRSTAPTHLVASIVNVMNVIMNVNWTSIPANVKTILRPG